MLTRCNPASYTPNDHVAAVEKTVRGGGGVALLNCKSRTNTARRLRIALLASSAMSAFGPSALTAAALLLTASLTISAALADGGRGGNPSGGSPDGRGGSGFTGNAGGNSFPDGARRRRRRR